MATKYKKGQDPDYNGGKRWPQRGGKAKRDPNAPKRPWSAFLLFLNEERPAVEAMYPDCNLGQIAKKLGESWKTYPNRSKFEGFAAKERERYEAELAEYIRKQNDSVAITKRDTAKAGKAAPATKRGSKSKPPAKKAKVDDDEDDEEEINEEEEEEEESD